MTMTLAQLHARWGQGYLITGAAGYWIAHRRRTGQMVTASSPEALDEALAASDAPRPAVLAQVHGDVQ